MKIERVLFLVIIAFLSAAPSVRAQSYDLSPLQRSSLQNFIAEQESKTLTFSFWTAHPPDADDPSMAIIWMARSGETPNEGTGIAVNLIATGSSGLSCLNMLRRGDLGTITLLKTDGQAVMCGAVLSIVWFAH